MNSEKDKLKEIIKDSDNIVFFGGAGVSTESGIPDFRSANGLYNSDFTYPPEKILSHSFFISHTDEFFRFYFEKMIYPNAQPNKAHKALALLEKCGKLKAVITQNIDGLHSISGSVNVLELHGSVYRNYCMECQNLYSLDEILNMDDIPLCSCGGVIKPDVVLYEEYLDNNMLEKAKQFISKADVLIAGGTSLNVNPAASLIRYYNGKKLILINKSETPFDAYANLIIRDNIGEILGSAVDI